MNPGTRRDERRMKRKPKVSKMRMLKSLEWKWRRATCRRKPKSGVAKNQTDDILCASSSRNEDINTNIQATRSGKKPGVRAKVPSNSIHTRNAAVYA